MKASSAFPSALCVSALWAIPAASSAVPSLDLRQEAGPSIGIHFYNIGDRSIYMSGDWSMEDCALDPELKFADLNHYIEPNKTVTITTKKETSPKFFLGLSPNNRTAIVGEKRDHDTVVEATFRNGLNQTYFDIDVEKGISVPVWCHSAGQTWEQGKGCVGEVLRGCEEHLQHYDNATEQMDQCRGEYTERDIKRRRGFCPQAYAVWSDDRRATQTIATEDLDLIHCYILNPKNVTSLELAKLPVPE